MAVYSVTLFINGNDDPAHIGPPVGWSESYHFDAADQAAAQLKGELLVTARSLALPDRYLIVYARASNLAIKGDAIPLFAGVPVAGQIAVTGDILPPQCAVLVTFFDAAFTTQAPRLFRGLSEADSLSGGYTLAGPVTTALDTFWDELVANSVGVAFRANPAAPWTIKPYASFISSTRHRSRQTGRPFGLLRGRHT